MGRYVAFLACLLDMDLTACSVSAAAIRVMCPNVFLAACTTTTVGTGVGACGKLRTCDTAKGHWLGSWLQSLWWCINSFHWCVNNIRGSRNCRFWSNLCFTSTHLEHQLFQVCLLCDTGELDSILPQPANPTTQLDVAINKQLDTQVLQLLDGHGWVVFLALGWFLGLG